MDDHCSQKNSGNFQVLLALPAETDSWHCLLRLTVGTACWDWQLALPAETDSVLQVLLALPAEPDSWHCLLCLLRLTVYYRPCWHCLLRLTVYCRSCWHCLLRLTVYRRSCWHCLLRLTVYCRSCWHCLLRLTMYCRSCWHCLLRLTVGTACWDWQLVLPAETDSVLHSHLCQPRSRNASTYHPGRKMNINVVGYDVICAGITEVQKASF